MVRAAVFLIGTHTLPSALAVELERIVELRNAQGAEPSTRVFLDEADRANPVIVHQSTLPTPPSNL